MGVILRKSSRPVSAALSVPSKAYTYRFFLSFCFLVLILFSLTFRHADVGIFILCLMNYLFCADVFLRTALKDVWSGNISWAVLTASLHAVFTFGLLSRKVGRNGLRGSSLHISYSPVMRMSQRRFCGILLVRSKFFGMTF